MLAFARHCASFVRHYGIVASLREVGPLIKELLFQSEERAERADGFDGRRGTDTSGMVMPWELKDQSNAPADSNPYASLTSDHIRALLGAVPVVAGETVLVDLGSGKGRVLLVAQEVPFKRIVGVEWSSELHAVAEKNLRSPPRVARPTAASSCCAWTPVTMCFPSIRWSCSCSTRSARRP